MAPWAVTAMVVAVTLFTIVPSHASAQTLVEALAAAYVNNPKLQAERAALRAVDEKVPQALSGYRPTITATAQVGRSNVNSSSAFFSAKQNRNPKNYQLSLEQPLYSGGRTVAGTRQAENDVMSQRARLLAREQDVLLNSVIAFMNVVRDQAVVRLNIGNEQVLQRRLEATQDQFEVGEVTRTDVSQAEARLAGATADRIQAEGDLQASRAVYRNVVGEAPGKLVAPKPPQELPSTVEEGIAASKENPSVIAATYAEKAALNSVDMVIGELLPTVSLKGELTRSVDGFSRGSTSSAAQISAQLKVPLYQAGSVTARVREARQTAVQRRDEVEGAERDAAEAADRAWQALETARARIKSIEAQISANKIALEGVRQEATVGSRTILNILDAQQELLNSRVTLVRAQRDATVASFQLKAAIGRLTAADLDLPVKIYSVESHYEKVRGKIWGLGGGGD